MSSAKSTPASRRPDSRSSPRGWRWLSRAEAEGFYAVHRERPFFRDLVDFMTSGPVMIQVLEGENAIAKNRDLMGATDPKKAARGHDPRRFRAVDRRQRRARLRRAGDRAASKSPTSSRRWRSTAARKPRIASSALQLTVMTNLLDLDRRRPRGLLRRSRREAVSRAAGVALGAPAVRRRRRRDDRPRASRCARSSPRRATIAGPKVIRDTTAADGTRKWLLDVGQRQRGRDRSTSPRTTAARCASRRRPAARSTARSARPASRASTAT